MPKLSVRNLRKTFGKFEAVKDVSFDLDEGEVICLLGPSGCGKTTTLRMIAGLETPTSGDIYVDGERVNDVPPQKRGVGLVFQDFAVFPHMTVFDNIAFGPRMRQMSSIEIESTVKEVAKLVHLEEVLDKHPREIGLSEIQRVALGRAIILNPKILLMDEPLSNVDANVREGMRGELKRLQREIGIASIYVTHDQLEAFAIGDRIALMKDGLIEQIGSPDEIYAKPATLFVSQFIGSPSMNLIDCSLAERDGRLYLDAQNFSIEITEILHKPQSRIQNGGLVLGIRPEDMVLSTTRSADSVSAKVEEIELLGKKSIYHLDVGGISVLCKHQTLHGVDVGREVWASFKKERLRLFDRKSGSAII